ncbi:hypothetical protein Sjap_018537 [Stephania japonica]|uniref:Uncharacterized protein n=1 Tax=Stephania japonica TaxID=461633 RepID=A0AAP0I865_9MAGN
MMRARLLFGPASGIGSKWRSGPGDPTLGRHRFTERHVELAAWDRAQVPGPESAVRAEQPALQENLTSGNMGECLELGCMLHHLKVLKIHGVVYSSSCFFKCYHLFLLKISIALESLIRYSAKLWWCPAVMRLIEDDTQRLTGAPMVIGRLPTRGTGIGLSVGVVVQYSSYVYCCAASQKTTLFGGAATGPP